MNENDVVINLRYGNFIYTWENRTTSSIFCIDFTNLQLVEIQ